MDSRKAALFLTFFLVFSAKTRASVSWDEIRSLARTQSSARKAQEMEARALGNEIRYRGTWANPQLLGQFGTLRSGASSGPTMELTLTQTVPLTGKSALRREIAEKALEGRNGEVARFETWVEHQAILAAWRLVVRSELYSHGLERAERLRLIERYLATQPRASVRQRVELSIVKSHVLHLLRDQDQKRLELTQARQDLAFWTGRSIEAAELTGSIPPLPRIRPPPTGTHEKDPEWKEARNRADIARLEAGIASRERWPDLTVGAGYRIERVVPANEFAYGLLGLTLPLWDSGNSRSKAAEFRLLRADLELEDSERRIRLKHERQREQAQFDLEQLKRFPIVLVQEQERAIREAEVGFQQRIIDVNTFLQAETQTHEVLDEVYLSWQQYLESLSTLLLMMGESLRWENPG